MTTIEHLKYWSTCRNDASALMGKAAAELEALQNRIEELEQALHKLNSYDAPAEVVELRKQNAELREAFMPISHRLNTQDNRITQNPMFCVQIKRRDVGYDSAYATNKCWHDSAGDQTIYDDDENFKGEPEGSEWDEFGYVDRWETVMVAFTEKGCEEYLELNGHNDRRRAHNGEVRIYVESFNRCPEMILIREMIKALATQPEKTDDHA